MGLLGGAILNISSESGQNIEKEAVYCPHLHVTSYESMVKQLKFTAARSLISECGWLLVFASCYCLQTLKGLSLLSL